MSEFLNHGFITLVCAQCVQSIMLIQSTKQYSELYN